VLDIAYGGSPTPVDGLCGDVGWEELSDGVIVAGQPDGAPSWFPCNDLPSEKATYRIAVTTESPYTVVANGRLVERRIGASRTCWVYDQPEPMATYLATVQIGRYDRLTYEAAVPVHTVLPPRLRRAVAHDLERQPQMLAAFHDMFGPYPFSDYTVVVTDDDLEIPLEAQGLSVFGANHMDGRRGSERLVAHELAHQWFGNSLTVAHWRDIWLHEGFACYAEWLWSERADGRPAEAFAREAWEKLAALPQDLLLGDPGPGLMFDDRLYKRGALTLHALRRLTGDERFFGMLTSWATTHRHGSVSTDAFLAHAEQRTGLPVAHQLTAWLEARPLPALQ
jgi:aminopeptidase